MRTGIGFPGLRPGVGGSSVAGADRSTCSGPRKGGSRRVVGFGPVAVDAEAAVPIAMGTEVGYLPLCEGAAF